MYFNFYISAEIWGMMLVSLLALVAHGGLYFFDKWYKKKNIRHDNEVAGIIFGVLSLIYSLIVAFVIVAVWENYEQLNRTIEKETDNLNSVIVHSNMLPDSLKQPITAAIKAYCLKVTDEEWDITEYNKPYHGSAIPSLRVLLFRAQKDDRIEGNLLSLLDEKLSNITDLHYDRLSHTRAYVPRLIWMILIVDSVLVICFSYFLHMESILLKKIFLSILWTIIGLSLFLIYMLDHPFIGSTQVSKAPYADILKVLG